MISYLDHNATTPVRPEVLEAMLPWLREGWANPSSAHTPGQRARAAVERARGQVAALLGSRDESEIVFTSGGSEADALAVAGAAWQAFDESGGKRRGIVTSSIEHEAVRSACDQLRRRGFRVFEAPCGPDGAADAAALARAVGEETALVSLMRANNETGVLQPAAEACAAARAAGAASHVDAVQTLGKIPLAAESLGADLVAVSGHKIGAPKGVGALWVRRGVRLAPLLAGRQEKNRRGGTENVAGIVAFGAACELAGRELESEAARALVLRRRIEEGLRAIAGCRINGHPERRLPNTVSACFEGIEGHHLVVALDLEGICVSGGSACSSGVPEPSRVLLAMGLSPSLASSAVRISVGHGSRAEDAERLLAVLPGAVARLRRAVAA